MSSSQAGAAAFVLGNLALVVSLSAVRRWLTSGSAASLDVEQEVTVSAPGKALIAGGYLVLEAPNVGVTISSTSRFFTSVKVLPQAKAPMIENSIVSILVDSPQFRTSFEYKYDSSKDLLVQKGEHGNEFVEKCLSLTLAFIKQWYGEAKFHAMLYSVSSIGQLGLKLRADNDFYSQIKELEKLNQPLLSSSLSVLPKFLPCPLNPVTGKMEVAKTGMGSSAALTTSLVAALLQFFGVIRLGHRKADEDRRVVHNLSQLAHAVAQGKIGSGFDVAAAVYGSQVYQRFRAEPFAACMAPNAPAAVIYEAILSREKWSQSIRPLDLPPGLDLIMGDVCGGSSSASMAREVLRWRAEQPAEAAALWGELAALNLRVSALLDQLCALSRSQASTYSSMVAWASSHTTQEWSAYASTKTIPHWVEPLLMLLDLKAVFAQCRKLLKRMGDCAGVGIEPDSQTALVDATEAVLGVVAAGVPGAGGVDAVFAITLSEVSRGQVELLWADWGAAASKGKGKEQQQLQQTRVCPLLLRADVGALAGVRTEKLAYT